MDMTTDGGLFGIGDGWRRTLPRPDGGGIIKMQLTQRLPAVVQECIRRHDALSITSLPTTSLPLRWRHYGSRLACLGHEPRSYQRWRGHCCELDRRTLVRNPARLRGHLHTSCVETTSVVDTLPWSLQKRLRSSTRCFTMRRETEPALIAAARMRFRCKGNGNMNVRKKKHAVFLVISKSV